MSKARFNNCDTKAPSSQALSKSDKPAGCLRMKYINKTSTKPASPMWVSVSHAQGSAEA